MLKVHGAIQRCTRQEQGRFTCGCILDARWLFQLLIQVRREQKSSVRCLSWRFSVWGNRRSRAGPNLPYPVSRSTARPFGGGLYFFRIFLLNQKELHPEFFYTAYFIQHTYYFTASTTASKALGSFTASSAKIFLSRLISDLLSLAINFE